MFPELKGSFQRAENKHCVNQRALSRASWSARPLCCPEIAEEEMIIHIHPGEALRGLRKGSQMSAGGGQGGLDGVGARPVAPA